MKCPGEIEVRVNGGLPLYVTLDAEWEIMNMFWGNDYKRPLPQHLQERFFKEVQQQVDDYGV